MNPERDSDRRLRAWAREGIDRAPERFVWAALDDIERTPQRAPWRARLEGLGAGVRPFVFLAGAAALAVVALVFGASLVTPDIGPGAPRHLVPTDLQRVLLWENSMPASWTLDDLVTNGEAVRRIPIRTLTELELREMPVPTGYLGGRYTTFSGPDAVFMSWGLVFESPADAAAVMPFYENEMSSSDGWGLGLGVLAALGDEGYVFTGETTALMGAPGEGEPVRSQLYLWRAGNAVLAMGGWFDFDAAQLLAAAEGIDARAANLSKETR
jgi:hypothetical protein